ncbi:MAG: tetratricopeptide (TPR) repeat protein [Chitinophagales bacterium]|jgi:tetratricopeptide (TPR) repeat protein
MKYLILVLLLPFSHILTAQNTVQEDIDKLKTFVEAEDYRSAMLLGDKLIGEGIKEGYENQAGDVYLYRGIAKFEFEIFDDAIVDFKQAIAFNKNLTKSYLYIAEIYYDLSRYSSALENIIYYMNNHPNDVHGLAVKSKCLLELGEPMAAKIIIQKAIALVSSEPELYYVRSAINSALGEDEKACNDAQIAVRFGYELANNLVISFCESEDEEEEIEEAKK